MSISIAISWTYTELHVITMQGKKMIKSWSSTKPVLTLTDFSQALFDACNEMGLKQGGQVSIAYESDDHTHEFLELPRMSKKDLQKYLLRRIKAEKPFEEDAAWCYHEAHHGEKVEGVLLHLMPKSIVDAMIRVCDDFFFVAKRLVPLTEIYTSHIASLALDDKERLLLVALFENRTQMVVARGNGEVLFVRELGYTWHESDSSRLITDADRTLRYAKQRTGGGISRVIIMGDQAESAMAVLQKNMSLPIDVDESSADRFFWAKKVNHLPIINANNFIPKLARSALTRRTAIRAAVLAVAALMLVTIGFGSWVEYVVSGADDTEYQAEAEIDQLQQQIQQVQQQLTLAKNDQSKLNTLVISGLDLPVIFFDYLGHLMPADIVLVSAKIHRNKIGWDFRLRGNSSIGFAKIPELLKKLESTYSQTPWNASIDSSWQATWLAQLQAGAAGQDDKTGFEMNGAMR